MKFKLFNIYLIIVLNSFYLVAQEDNQEFILNIDHSKVEVGQPFTISYELINLDGDFEFPEIQGALMVAGPNVSRQFSNFNGKKSSKNIYSGIFISKKAQKVEIPSVFIHTEYGEFSLPSTVVEISNHVDEESMPILIHSTSPTDSLNANEKRILNKMKNKKVRKI